MPVKHRKRPRRGRGDLWYSGAASGRCSGDASSGPVSVSSSSYVFEVLLFPKSLDSMSVANGAFEIWHFLKSITELRLIVVCMAAEEVVLLLSSPSFTDLRDSI